MSAEEEEENQLILKVSRGELQEPQLVTAALFDTKPESRGRLGEAGGDKWPDYCRLCACRGA